MRRNIEIGVDTGGTFTDVVCHEPGQPLRVVKIPSTPKDPSEAVLAALPHMQREWGIQPDRIARFIHGTTVATNAVLERKGARIGLLTTAGFSDVIEIGRQLRHDTYGIALTPETPIFLAPGRQRREIDERIGAKGEVVRPLDPQQVRAAIVDLVDSERIEGLAVCFLFSFLNDAHEREVAAIARELYPDLPVSLSSDVNPAFREYERTVVTAFDAYIKPVINGYLTRLENNLKAAGVTAPLQIMQSRGGVAAAEIARMRPVNLFLSGPAGGVIGGRMAGVSVDCENLITVDVGGTSSDIALISRGKPILRAEGLIDGFPVRTGMVDVNAIGAGGGSIAWIDGGGGLRVGPESAGSDPGPACYGRGGVRATVTDASIVLGYLNPDYFAGGRLKLDPGKAAEVIERTIARPLGLSVEEAAAGIHKVVNAQMSEGIRLVSIKQGLDPRNFVLVPLGGAGALHATALAQDLGIDRIIVPQHPGVLAAIGHLCAPVEHAASVAIQKRLDDLSVEEVAQALSGLDRRCADLMSHEGDLPHPPSVRYTADVCYVGQSHHIEVPLHPGAGCFDRLRGDFLELHDRIFGYATAGALKIANVHAIHEAKTDSDLIFAAARDGAATAGAIRRVRFATTGEAVDTPIYQRTALAPGAKIHGPAIVEQADTTTVIDRGWTARVIQGGVLSIERNAGADA
ncbi:hydantoinase/oxoprolinase family protein [Azospirillum picis]|uniref:N-methylhydantoinase A/oxoprolinase/acetone carboxylase beta subunit n=1 Tax=Azospirillum picis TaxID=488438 RepID=A0ABU0MHM8_9PROT|nr:hydantoinase/oxoprolinase family protein [Azospirillum picis]MBP2298816.1 N-methylhydantoinase A/oxoprolinase/acetone carboxylase beta subunit [Azospirillum picis]MDQ0532942.1 N-methylhydantoinase A/oxoprolinase/acetone carboxylase beta subunit [Azospirillum picis]